ncbi:1-aminocyclopropane-1-carboxylate deaminase/D-cysteine desulfhydrase [Arachidicoccus sp.]|uniref:1-aminocyclopropane-1-carboxylate deaminase/D-cysteine desulfhydrase n=1 Tax=Arachidicoccus sp. TaxID=1872624 RepID=UPI003D247CCE
MFSSPTLEQIPFDSFSNTKVKVGVLRLDTLHPVISGNKWFKLKYYLQEAKKESFDTIATFGGAFSNHIVATAFAAKEAGIKSIGIIRGEKPATLSHTLQNAISYGMQLHFVSRGDYQEKTSLKNKFQDVFWIDEGGFGILGTKGVGDMFEQIDLQKYSHIILAVGTGTTMAGIIKKMLPHQKLYGISVMKNNTALLAQIDSLLSIEEAKKNFELLHNFHFGGYARKTQMLLDFMNETFTNVNLPLDFVYTAKAFYALHSLSKENTIPSGSTVLFIHTGGLQGNLSLAPGTLLY